MKAKAFLVVLLFIIWSVGSGWYYVCKIKKVCPSSELEQNNTSITFKKSSAEPQLNENFESFKSLLLKDIGDSNKLEIIGLYGSNELNTTSFNNLGIARAMQVQQLFEQDIANNRIRLSSEEFDFGSEILHLDGIKFRIIKKQLKTDLYEETDFGAILYFNEEVAPSTIPVKTEAFLIMLHKDNVNRQIDVVGHTDDSGGEGENFELGLQRANMVREMLIAHGANPDNITASSKGQTEPIADNSTAKGRAQNRRVEILIN